MTCRLLVDPPDRGAWNMAVDETLLEWAAATGGCCWRMYGWSEPTLSLGYFQEYGQRQQHAASRQALAVRRLTGGGAIVHDRELTYSLVLPGQHPLAASRDRLYKIVHTSLIATLAEFGVSARLCSPSHAQAPREEPFLCFQRRAQGDVLAGKDDMKIAGSAQRRRRGAVLQHGSILLRSSPCAPELPGILEACGGDISFEQLIEAWRSRLPDVLNISRQPQPLSSTERAQAEQLMAARYTAPAWTENRQR